MSPMAAAHATEVIEAMRDGSPFEVRPLDAKVIATLKARAALVGVALHVTDDDRGAPLFVASKWAMARQLHSVAEVEKFLRAIGGPNA